MTTFMQNAGDKSSDESAAEDKDTRHASAWKKYTSNHRP
jgi:hypothetical protein